VGSIIVLSAIGVLALIAYDDVRTRRIPNVLSIAIASLGLIRIVLVGDPSATGYTLLASAAAFAITLLLFWCGAIGGGDAKLIPAVVLLVGYRETLGFLFLMSLFGGALALAIAALSKMRSGRDFMKWPLQAPLPAQIVAPAMTRQRPTVPYGVAISAAGAITLITAR
jgi:prepilin peptidase CpaA